MSAVIFYLLHNPEWLSRALEEIRSTFSSSDDICLGPALSSCKVLLACIEESQRLTPTAPNGPPRTVDAGGITIDGHHLAEGTVVNGPIFHVQREEAYFESPHAFKPERWMVHESTAVQDAERIKHQQKAHMPFHIGPRSCKSDRPRALFCPVIASVCALITLSWLFSCVRQTKR
jgi:cytochrome P450